MVRSFMKACLTGDMGALMSLLTEDVMVWSDGGGKVSGALRHPLQGREKVARAIIGLLSRAPEGTTFEMIEANGFPALLVLVKAQMVGILTLEVEGELIRALRSVANPDKLAHLNQPPTATQEWRIKS